MADKKISQLDASTTPLAGTEVLPIVQSGVTKQVSVANLTAGRAVAASQLDVDNIRIDGNTVSSTNTNGDIIFDPDGTGVAVVQGVSGAATGTVNAPVTMLIKDTQEVGSGGDITNAWGKLKWATVDTSSGGPGGGAEIGVSYANQFGVGARMYIATSENNAAPKKRMQFEPYGNVQIYLNDAVTIHSEFVAATGNLTVNTGNLVIGTSGKGIDFSATAGTGTSELLNDYEEGTWTPVIGGDATYLQQIGYYTKIGRLVTVNFLLQVNVKGTGSAAAISGLPYATANVGGRSSGSLGYWASTAINVISIIPTIPQAGGSALIFSTSAAASTSNTDSAAVIGNGTYLMGSLTYQTA